MRISISVGERKISLKMTHTPSDQRPVTVLIKHGLAGALTDHLHYCMTAHGRGASRSLNRPCLAALKADHG